MSNASDDLDWAVKIVMGAVDRQSALLEERYRGSPVVPGPPFPGSFVQPATCSASSTTPSGSPSTTLPTDLSLHSKLNTIQAELGAVITVINQLAASVAQLQAGQTTPTPTTTTSTTPTNTTSGTPTNTAAPLLFLLRPQHPCTIASGRGAASPEVFQQMIKNNWHGRLGRTHMADVDGLPATALTELDCFLRRKLHTIFPRGGGYSEPDADKVFASLAVLGLRLEDRGAYADLPVISDSTLHDATTIQRGKNFALYYYGKSESYWRGSVLETLIELASYRGLFDEGFLKKE